MWTFCRRVAESPPSVRALLLSEVLTLFAGAIGQISVAWWIAQAHGASDLARYGAFVASCTLITMPLMSPLGDRLSKSRLIRWGSAILVLDVVVLGMLAHSGVYRLTMLCACSALSILANAVLLPAQASILPELVETERLPDAIRLSRSAQALGGLLGPGLGGVALVLFGLSGAMALSVLMSAGAAIAAWRLRDPQHPSRQAKSYGWFGEMSAGLRAKWGVPLDRWWTLTGALMMVFLFPATGMLLPLRIHALGLSAIWFGSCSAALSFGLLAGMAATADFIIDRLGRVRSMLAAVLACGLAVGLISQCNAALALATLFFVIGLCMSITQLVGQTHRMLAMPEEFRSRMTSGHQAVGRLAAIVAPALAGELLQHWPVTTVYLLLATGFLASGLLLLTIPELMPFLRLDHETVKGWYLRHYPGAFARPQRDLAAFGERGH
jgi:MFS family permease